MIDRETLATELEAKLNGGCFPGDLVEIVPSHCDTTINLHDEYVVHRGGTIVERWPIAARGKTR